MGQVRIEVAGRSYRVGCRDGEEPHVRALGRRLESLTRAATSASGGQSSEHVLLYIAMMLADQLNDAERKVGAAPVEGIDPALLDRLAQRLEAVATALEEEPVSA